MEKYWVLKLCNHTKNIKDAQKNESETAVLLADLVLCKITTMNPPNTKVQKRAAY